MAFFHFNTLRKYTASILNLFNEIEVENTLSDGKKIYTKIPIQYANKERYDIYSQLSYNQFFNGNTQVLPRAILLFNNMSLNQERAKNKFVKLYRKVLNINNVPQKLNYQFNSVPYDFEFQVVVQCRGMNEAAMIVEQITSYFNPTYCLRIKEIDLPDFGYTSCILDLVQTSIQQSDMDEYSINVVTIEFDIVLRGNIYPAIKEQEVIKMIQLFLSTSYIDENNVVRVYSESNTIEQQFINQYKSAIKDIKINNDTLECIIDSKCEKLIKFNYEWFINGVKYNSNDSIISYAAKNNDIIRVRAFTDIVETDFFEKINKIEEEPEVILKITDITYDGVFLECCLHDDSKDIIKYSYKWFINGEIMPQTQRIIRYETEKTFGCKCIVKSSDNRIFEFYKNIKPGAEYFDDYITMDDDFQIETIAHLNLKTNAFLATDSNFEIEDKKVEFKNNPFMVNIDNKVRKLNG